MFDADRPIEYSSEDRLNRTVFCKYLARCILDHESPESLTIGLYGPWGVGKTSVINLVLEELRFAASNLLDREKPILLNFNPWNYSGQENLIFSFFRRLSSEMRQAEFFVDNDEKSIMQTLELYISFFTHQPVPKPLRPKVPWWHKKKDEAAIGWESGQDLIVVKRQLNEKLKAKRHKYIIFIDNISRLPPEEILQIFQLVKSIADFANTVFILSLDKQAVSFALNKLEGRDSGTDFLEKVIQLPFDLPPIARQDVEIILLDRLREVIKSVPENSWDVEYWADIYYSTLKFFFTNCRDITRYINTLSFGYIHVRDVVNPVDFFAITAVEVFEPDVYYGIRANKDLFVDLFDTIYQFDAEKLAEDRMRCDEILNRARKIPAEMLQLLLIRLFPRLRHLYPDYALFHHSEIIARKHKRICTYDVFEIYFRLAIVSFAMGDDELDVMLALTKDETGFGLALLRLNQDERVLKFLDLLDGNACFRIPEQNIPHVINALLDSADLFPQGQNNFLSFSTPMRIHRIFHQLLQRYKNQAARYHVFSAAITKAINSLYIIIHELQVQSANHLLIMEAEIPEEQHDFSKKDLELLKKLALQKIGEWAKIGRLIEHPELIPILFAWREWGDAKACEAYLLEALKDDRRFILFLTRALNEPIQEAIIHEKTNPEWIKYLTNITDLIKLEDILPHATQLFKDNYFLKLAEKEQLALLIFLDLVKPNTVKVFPDITARE